jgi:hypothetical protein
MHVKFQPQNDFFGPVGFGRVVFWSSCRLVKLSFGQVGFCRPAWSSCGLVELSHIHENNQENKKAYVFIHSRAGVCLKSSSSFRPLSTDFTPDSDRQRIQHIAFQRPELLRCPHTKEKLYNRHILSRKASGFAA